MKLAEGIQLAYERKWSMINTFNVEIHLPNKLIDEVGNFSDDLNLSIKSITTNDFTNDPIESFIANRWFIQNGKDSLYRFSITFRDYNQLSLYRKFMKIYNFAKENYFDTCAFTVVISKDADWEQENDRHFMTYSGTMVESVSNLSFNNETENEIAEFTVNFKSVYPAIN